MKDVTSHSHLSRHFSFLRRERRKKMLKKTSAIPGQQNLHENKCQSSSPKRFDLQMVTLYVIIINTFGVLKALTKKIVLEKLENWCEYQLLQDGGDLKDTLSTSKISSCSSDYLSLLKLYLLFQTYLLPIWCIIFHVEEIIWVTAFRSNGSNASLQNMIYSEMKLMFFKKVDQIIFVAHEIQILQPLLHEYREIDKEYGFDAGKLKSYFIITRSIY